MTTSIINQVAKYVEDNIGFFHNHRLAGLKRLNLQNILARKNPYLFRVKNILTAETMVKALLEAHLSSQEETIFGDWLESLCIFVNGAIYQGRKSGITGIDLEFDKDNIRHIVAIKSGPNWGNSSQIEKMKDNFIKAKKTLRTSGSDMNVNCVNGCCYGRDNNPDKGDYFKYCGQQFWEFISGESELFIEVIEPLGKRAKENNDEFAKAYAQIINQFTASFIEDYCTANGDIDWEKFVRFNSSK